MTEFDKFWRFNERQNRYLMFQERLRRAGKIEALKLAIRRYTTVCHHRHLRRWDSFKFDPRWGLMVSVSQLQQRSE